MTASTKKLIRFIVAAIFLVAAFFAGRWTQSLSTSLAAESDYPWNLHHRIAEAGIDCKKLSSTSTGSFYVKTLGHGEIIVIASLDQNKSMANASIIDSAGHVATDSWPIDCR